MTEKKRGRPLGRKSNPDYVQVAGYIPKTLFRRMKHLLIDRDDPTISTLLEELISQWVTAEEKKRKS